jgi:7-cyano-7-deazaguanine synthase in queuosine biosynthesis
MKLICGPASFSMQVLGSALPVTLYGQPGAVSRGSAGDAVRWEITRRQLHPTSRAWDLLSLALSVMVADTAGARDRSPDGWTREFELHVAVVDPAFWQTQVSELEAALAFLTTDRWQLHFYDGGFLPAPPNNPVRPDDDSVLLLSGGLDSLVGAIDLVASGRRPFTVSKTVRGDAEKQKEFALRVGNLSHLQLNDNAEAPGASETSQRARSLMFMAFGIVVATTLRRYDAGEVIPLNVCENGFIAINPPLTGGRLGSLSTRTVHPTFVGRLQRVLDAAGLRVRVTNPYQLTTKGEMLSHCADQPLLRLLASSSTSCGRFLRFNYRHCGRCVPCQVRRAAFLAWGAADTTNYVYQPLGQDDEEHARFDDVRAVAMAVAHARADGLDGWLAGALASPFVQEKARLRDMLGRGLAELEALHAAHGVR